MENVDKLKRENWWRAIVISSLFSIWLEGGCL